MFEETTEFEVPEEETEALVVSDCDSDEEGSALPAVALIGGVICGVAAAGVAAKKFHVGKRIASAFKAAKEAFTAEVETEESSEVADKYVEVETEESDE